MTRSKPPVVARRRESFAGAPGTLLLGVLVAAVSGCGDGRGLPTDPGTDPDTTPAPEATHSASVLPGFGDARSNGWVLNDAGVAAGWSDLAGGRAVRWSEAGVVSDLLGETSGTRGINNAGTVVGWVTHPDGYQHGFVFADGVRTDLSKIHPGGHGLGAAINDAGIVVGQSPVADGGRAVVWRPAPDGGYGEPLDLGFGSPTQIPRINGRGDVAFSAYIWGVHRPAIWPIGPDGEYGDPVWLGRPADGGYFAMDLNDRGVIVGFRQAPWGDDPPVAVVWLPDDYDAPIDLGIGEAWGINDQDQIVGTTGGSLPTFGGQPRRPALWTIEIDGSITGPQDIGSPSGHRSAAARDINENGWIIGSSWGPGPVTATLWKPRS